MEIGSFGATWIMYLDYLRYHPSKESTDSFFKTYMVEHALLIIQIQKMKDG